MAVIAGLLFLGYFLWESWFHLAKNLSTPVKSTSNFSKIKYKLMWTVKLKWNAEMSFFFVLLPNLCRAFELLDRELDKKTRQNRYTKKSQNFPAKRTKMPFQFFQTSKQVFTIFKCDTWEITFYSFLGHNIVKCHGNARYSVLFDYFPQAFFGSIFCLNCWKH